MQICVTCLSSESVEFGITPIFFAEAEEVTDEVATLKLTEKGSRTVLSMENQHLRLINVKRALEELPKIDDLNDT